MKEDLLKMIKKIELVNTHTININKDLGTACATSIEIPVNYIKSIELSGIKKSIPNIECYHSVSGRIVFSNLEDCSLKYIYDYLLVTFVKIYTVNDNVVVYDCEGRDYDITISPDNLLIDRNQKNELAINIKYVGRSFQ